MATEGHSFMFGGSKKRSTLVEEKVVLYNKFNFLAFPEKTQKPQDKKYC
jgi:hypothetical protein